jgi:hypothetical protein
MNGAFSDGGSYELFAIRLPDANVSRAKELATGWAIGRSTKPAGAR